MSIDTKKLREALPRVPRQSWSKYRATVSIPETEEFAGLALSISGLQKSYARALAGYIAAANPATTAAMLDHIDAQAAEIEALRQPWISVEDRLPEPGVSVMVYTPPQPEDWPDDVRLTFDYIDPESDGVWYHHAEHYCCVAKGGDVEWQGPSETAPYTHWMPLPAPPVALSGESNG